MNPARDICDLMQTRASSGRDAFKIAETTLIKIIRTLRRDPRFADITRSEFELLLANEHRELEVVLFNAKHDRIHLDDAKDAVRCCLGEEE